MVVSVMKNPRKSVSLEQTLVVTKGYEESQSHTVICLAVLLAEATAKYEGCEQEHRNSIDTGETLYLKYHIIR